MLDCLDCLRMFRGAQRLPTSCECGFDGDWRLHSGDACSQAGLRNHVAFPPFRLLPHDNDISLTYFTDPFAPGSGGVARPRISWCFLGD